MSKLSATRIPGRHGETVGYDYRGTVIDKQHQSDGTRATWVISGFGPDGWTEHDTLAQAKTYIDEVMDA